MMKKNQFLILLVALITSCVNAPEKKRSSKQKDELVFIDWEEFRDEEIVSNYFKNHFSNEFRKKLLDQFDQFIQSRKSQFKRKNQYFIDSNIMVNKTGDKVIIYEGLLYPESKIDANYMPWYGKKINNNWYFTSGTQYSLFKPEEGNNTTEIIHEFIKKASRAYLCKNKDDSLIINQNYFSYFAEFESEPKKSEYPRNQLEKNRIFVVNALREFYQDKMVHEVYKPKDFSFQYNESKKELTITCPIKKWNEFPVGYSFYWERMGEKFDYNDFEKNQIFIPMNQNSISTTFKNIKANDDFGFVMNFVGSPVIPGVGIVFYKFKLQNGKAKFVGLVPDETDILDLPKKEQDSEKRFRQKLINERLGRNYGK